MFVGMGANSGGAYNLESSLRFRSSASAYLSRTPASAGNRKTWTWSAWVKRGKNTAGQWLFGAGPVSTDFTLIRFGSGGAANDYLEYVRVVGGAVNAQKTSNQVFRDTSAWYHIVVVEDAANTVARIYVNGSEISYSTNTNPTNVNGAINNTVPHEIGRYVGVVNAQFDGYLTEVNFVDGQALTADDFGEYDDTTGVWKPKAYTGTYGTNGFYLPFTGEITPTVTAGFGGIAENVLYDDTAYLISNTSTGSGFDLVEYDFGESINMIDYNIQDLRFTGGVSTFRIYTSDVGGSLSNYTERVSLSVSSSYQNYTGNLGVTARYVKIRATNFGTNGQAYLNYFNVDVDSSVFSDNSGNVNNWTPNNINLITDIMNDVPTLTDEDTGNFCTLNPLVIGDGGTMSDGNLTFTTPTATRGFHAASIGINSGKWYWEVTCSASTYDSTNRAAIGYKIGNERSLYYVNNATDGDLASMGFYIGDTVGFAFDADNGTVENFINGVSNTTVTGIDMTKTWFPIGADAHTAQNGTVHWNFGQRPFKYTPPTGYKKLNTYNLPDSTIKDGSQYMNTVLFDAQNSSQSITGVGFSPDLVWLKNRTSAGNHYLLDSIRGPANLLYSDSTSAEGTAPSFVTSLDNDGFTINSNAVYTSGNDIAAWNWRGSDSSAVSNTDGTITSTVSANTTSGFSIVTWTGDGGSNQSVGHGLSEQPDMVIVKKRNKSENWYVASTSSGYDTNFGYHLHLNTTGAVEGNNDPYYLNSIGSVADKLLLSNGTSNNGGNENGINYVAYCWHSVEGFSKIGSYTGNGSTDGPFVYTGFRPAFVLARRTDGVQNWTMYDSARDTDNVVQNLLVPNTSGAEATYAIYDFLSNGFKLRNTDTAFNGSGANYIYMAFAENPFKQSLAR